MATKRKGAMRGLGLYSPPERYDVDPQARQKRVKGLGEGNYESQTSANINASTYNEMKKRTKRQGPGGLGIYS